MHLLTRDEQNQNLTDEVNKLTHQSINIRLLSKWQMHLH